LIHFYKRFTVTFTMPSDCLVCLVPCTRVCSCAKASYCSVECQRRDWRRHKESCPVVSVRQIQNKGRGMVANRSLGVGQIILTEKPLMLVNCNPQSKPHAQVVRKFKKLCKKDKAKYLELGHDSKEGDKKILTIFERNCVSVRIKENDDDWRGIYVEFSKTNHACAPNSVINILNSEREITLVASKAILKGEEIVLNYLDPYRGKKPSLMLRFERRSALNKFWSISCTCNICNLRGQELLRNEEIKTNIINLDNKKQQFGNIHIVDNAMNSLTLEQAILELMFKLSDEMTREIPDCLMKCYLYAKVLQIHGARLSTNPDHYLRIAMNMAIQLGSMYVRRVNEREREYDEFISEATRILVEARKSRLVTFALWEP